MSHPIPDKLIRNLGDIPLARVPRFELRDSRTFTPALYETAKLLSSGKTDPEIARHQRISLPATKDRVLRLLAYFDAKNRRHLIAVLHRERIV
jgi:DNA-binding CsgD family transcriptional regulator